MELDPIEVQKHLKGVSYPASGEDLAEAADGNGAPEEIVDALISLSGHYDGPDEVQAALSD